MNNEFQVIKGAIEKDTNKFILPQFGFKGIIYKCFDDTCKMDVIRVNSYRRQDDTIIPSYFRHTRLTDEDDCKCKRYSRRTKLSDYEIHKEGVMNLKYVLDNDKINKRVVRYCPCCLKNKIIDSDIEILQHNERIETEYTFSHNGRNLRADIARIRDGNIYQIYEIKYSHSTREEDRPTDIEWYEIDAIDINKQLEKMENFDDREIILSCNRTNNLCENCMKNKEKRELEMKEAIERLREEEIRCNAERERKRLIKMKEEEDREEEDLIYKQYKQSEKLRAEERYIKHKEEQEITKKLWREEQEIKDKLWREEKEIKDKLQLEEREIKHKLRREEQEIKDKLRREEEDKSHKIYLEQEKQRNIKKYTPEQYAMFKEYDDRQAKIRANFARIGIKW